MASIRDQILNSIATRGPVVGATFDDVMYDTFILKGIIEERISELRADEMIEPATNLALNSKRLAWVLTAKGHSAWQADTAARPSDTTRGDVPATTPEPAAAPDNGLAHTLSLSTACLAPDTFDAWWGLRDLGEKADIFRTYHEALGREERLEAVGLTGDEFREQLAQQGEASHA